MEEKQTIRKCPRCGYSPSGKERSGNQNRYYWGCVIQILSEDTGYTKDEMHEIIKHKFLLIHSILETKQGRKVAVEFSRSTTELDTKEFENLMSEIREWASMELGIYIQNPGEYVDNT